MYIIDDLSVTTTVTAPTRRYALETTAHFSAAAVECEPGEQRVIDVSEIEDTAVREAVERSLTNGGWRTDEVPSALAATVDRYDFFTWEARAEPDDPWTHFGLALYGQHPDRTPLITFDAAVTEATIRDDSSGKIEFVVTSTAEATRRLLCGAPPPFGVLYADRRDENGGSDDASDRHGFALWGDYEDSGHVSVQDGELVWDAIGLDVSIEPGETIARTYELRADTDAMEPGRYVVFGELESEQDHEPPETVSWRVEFTLQPDTE